ncbi:MAG: hypothetical protein QM820_31120 [Minicystis sp.]
MSRKKAPRGFNQRVRRPGDRWLAEHPEATRVPPYWSRVRAQVIAAFEERCAYTAMWLSHDGEIDHFISIHEDRRKAYRWSNLRYAASWFNSSKQNVPSTQILDPFEVGDGWFEIVLPSLELVVTDQCPESLRSKARFMLDRLGLAKGERVMRSRARFYAIYNPNDPATLAFLDQFAPLIARAIRKQQATQPSVGAEGERAAAGEPREDGDGGTKGG